MQHACALLRRSNDPHVFDRTALTVGWSARHLRRAFLDYVGTTPSEYVRLRRFKHALSIMRPQATLTAVAHLTGYHDQAHFCRDFKEFAGLTPGVYRERAGRVPGLLFSADVRLIQVPKPAIV